MRQIKPCDSFVGHFLCLHIADRFSPNSFPTVPRQFRHRQIADRLPTVRHHNGKATKGAPNTPTPPTPPSRRAPVCKPKSPPKSPKTPQKERAQKQTKTASPKKRPKLSHHATKTRAPCKYSTEQKKPLKRKIQAQNGNAKKGTPTRCADAKKRRKPSSLRPCLFCFNSRPPLYFLRRVRRAPFFVCAYPYARHFENVAALVCR